MGKATIITTSILGGLVATTLVAGGSFALASSLSDNSTSRQSTNSSQSAQGSAHSNGNGPNSAGQGNGNGSPADTMNGLADVESGTLTSEQELTLATMAEEEKLAHDLYIAFGDLYGDTVFDRVSSAETKHLSAVQTLLERYNLADPTAGQDLGEFASESMQTLYDTYLAQGTASRDGAYEAARTVERNDISDITAASEGLSAPDVLAVYEHLLSGSEKHLVAFGG